MYSIWIVLTITGLGTSWCCQAEGPIGVARPRSGNGSVGAAPVVGWVRAGPSSCWISRTDWSFRSCSTPVRLQATAEHRLGERPSTRGAGASGQRRKGEPAAHGILSELPVQPIPVGHLPFPFPAKSCISARVNACSCLLASSPLGFGRVNSAVVGMIMAADSFATFIVSPIIGFKISQFGVRSVLQQSLHSIDAVTPNTQTTVMANTQTTITVNAQLLSGCGVVGGPPWWAWCCPLPHVE